MPLLIFLLALLVAPLAAAQQPDAALIARAEAGDGDAMDELAIAYLDANDVAQALRWARASAEAGRPEGMNNYAAVLRLNDEEAEAERWERAAEAAGSTGAALNRAMRLILTDPNGPGWAEGFAVLESVEHPGIDGAILQIALNYAQTPGADAARGRQLFGLAGERGSAEAQWNLAMMLINGVGGPVDLPQAYGLTRRAGEAGFVNGQISTAVMLAIGQGVAEDDVEARRWYQRAAEQRSAAALASLGGMLMNGEGGSVNAPLGWAYITLAADAGDPRGRAIQNFFNAQVSETDRRLAEQLRAAWIVQHGAPQ